MIKCPFCVSFQIKSFLISEEERGRESIEIRASQQLGDQGRKTSTSSVQPRLYKKDLVLKTEGLERELNR